MTAGEVIGGRCERCGHVSFPPRLWCPACGEEHFRAITLTEGVVRDSVTTGREPGTTLVDVGCDLGPALTARAVADQPIAAGQRVALSRGDRGEMLASALTAGQSRDKGER